MMKLGRTGAIAGAVAFALLLAACSSGGNTGSTPGNTGSTPKALTPIDVYFGSTQAQGQHLATYALGKNKGFYSEVGLDPTFHDGTGSTAIAQQVAAGKIDIATEITPPSALSVAAAGGGLVTIGQTLPVLPEGVVSLKKITKPSQLKGLKIAVPAGTVDASVWPHFLAAQHLSESDVTTVNIATNTLDQALVSGAIDGLVAFTYTHVATLKGLGKNPSVLSFADFGFKISPGESIIANKDWLKSAANQKIATAFLEGTAKTLNYSLLHPQAVADAGFAQDSSIFHKQTILLQMQAMTQLIKGVTPKALTSTDPSVVLGMNSAEWTSQIAELSKFNVIPSGTTLKASDVYTTKYLK